MVQQKALRRGGMCQVLYNGSNWVLVICDGHVTAQGSGQADATCQLGDGLGGNCSSGQSPALWGSLHRGESDAGAGVVNAGAPAYGLPGGETMRVAPMRGCGSMRSIASLCCVAVAATVAFLTGHCAEIVQNQGPVEN